MTNEFIAHALQNGEEGEKWLKSIPNLIKRYEQQWDIKVAEPFHLSYNYVAPATRPDGSDVVLKIGFPKDNEFQTEVRALEVFQGEGIERLLEEDRDNAVILIERVLPGAALSTLTEDEEATRILARVMRKLWKPLPANHQFNTIQEWMRAIPKYLAKGSLTGNMPRDLVEKANSLFEELLATSDTPMLLHGDLHHDNVLSSRRGGWLAIDPKGIAAEPAYEVAAMIRNPYPAINNFPDLPEILRKRILIFAEELGFDPERLRKWCFAQTILSGVWNDAGVKGSEHAVKIAQILEQLTFS